MTAVAIARVAVVSTYLSPGERDALELARALDAHLDVEPNPAPAGCTCNTEAWCDTHDRSCACSDRFGRCHAGCETCFGSGAVGVQEACLPRCKSCKRAETATTGVRVAVDREAAPMCSAAQVMVLKPAIDEPWLLAEAAANRGQQVVVTSYMDHPLGQAFAAWEAARLGLTFRGLLGVCGLQTHHLFQADAFSELLGGWSPSFQSPGGTGLGFDDLLDALPWTRLA